MYMDLMSSFIGLSTSNSESELEREKILLSFFLFSVFGLSSSVAGGVSGNLPVLGTLMLPLGFFRALMKAPLFILGLGGPWIFVISLMRMFKLGGCREVKFIFIIGPSFR